MRGSCGLFFPFFSSFLFLSVSFLFVLLSVSLSFSGVHKYHGYVPGIISMQVIRDGIPQLVSTVPLRTGTGVLVMYIFLPSRRFCSLFGDHGLDFRERSQRENIIINHFVEASPSRTEVTD